jgi:DNA-binding CsgD family transcriptional regulator/Tfp pilus assembly protein PilF
MRTVPAAELVETAQQALGRGDFTTAVASFEAALEIEPHPAAQDGLAYLAYANDDFETARTLWELSYKGYKDAGDLKKASLVAVNLAGVYYDGFGNESAAHGWLNRADRLLERVGRCVERGYLALALVGCNMRDANALEQSAAVALELALEFGESDLEAKALADGGLALINQGRIAKGFAQLDEAMAAVSAGEVSPIFSGKIFCALLTACERTGDLKRAEEWTQTCTRYLEARVPGKLPILHAHCRTAYGVVLCDTGRWNEGETEIMHALGPGTTTAVSKNADSTAALAGLRLMQGRIEEAAELLAPYADRFEVCEQMAKLHLLRGEYDLCIAVAVRGLHDLVGDRLRAGRLLSLMIEAELGRDNVEGAERAHERLDAAAEASDSLTLRAAAKLGEARIAKHQGRADEAVTALQAAAKQLSTEERPVLAGRISFELADALAKTGNTAEAIAEGRSALAIFERLGADRDADQVAALLRSLGAPGRTRARDKDAAVSALTAREKDVFALLGEGLTNAEIAERLFITPKTAEHHVGRILSKLGVRSRTEAAAIAGRS